MESDVVIRLRRMMAIVSTLRRNEFAIRRLDIPDGGRTWWAPALGPAVKASICMPRSEVYNRSIVSKIRKPCSPIP